jgi:60 kDa SS-A/Ro ribonucleoprotein
MLPDAALTHPPVWEALLLNHLPQTALLRQLPRLTRIGVLTQTSFWTDLVVKQLTYPILLRKARVHPLSILVALKTYASGQGRRDTNWIPVPKIIDALDAAFYAAFDTVEPTNKRIMLALDVSGSMTSPLSNLPITCREATAALAMVTASTEPNHLILGFSEQYDPKRSRWGGWRSEGILTPLPISPRQRLDDVCSYMDKLPFSGTDCALPMLYAMKNNLEIDTFVVITDNETFSGSVHPHQALVKYRKWSGIGAKLIVVGMTATEFSIADKNDPGSLDIVGMDTSVPTLIADFSRGL